MTTCVPLGQQDAEVGIRARHKNRVDRKWVVPPVASHIVTLENSGPIGHKQKEIT